MNGEHVGEWRVPANGVQEFVYTESWLASPSVRPISLSMPLRPSRQPYRAGVEAFFANLLPDNRQILERIQRRFQAESLSAFALLQEIGRDCVGALQILPVDETAEDVRKVTGVKLSRGAVAKLLARSVATPLGRDDPNEEPFRISLAGAQEKTALLWHEGAWHLPTGTTPTTHIFKLPMGISPQGIDLSRSVENEWLCAQIVRAYGIPVAPCRMERFGEQSVLVVERFDRRLSSSGKWWLRLPQEDFCQATGTPPALKYENDGGPGIRTIMDLLLGSQNAMADRADFLRTNLVFWLLGAIDGHAKNFSLSLLPGGAYRLTPRYDILSAYPMMGRGRGRIAPQKLRMAMAVQGKNRHYGWDDIGLRHWIETARRCGFPGMDAIIGEVLERTPSAITSVQPLIPAGFSEETAGSILDGLRAASERLKAEIKS